MKNINFKHNFPLKWFVLANHNDFFNNSSIFGKLSARTSRKHIVLYVFETLMKSYERNEQNFKFFQAFPTKIRKTQQKIYQK